MKAKVREFNGVIKTNFSDDKISKENMHYTCIACITIDSIMRMKKKKRIISRFIQKNGNTGQKKQKTTNFTKTELESDQDSELESDAELESKSELESDTE